MKNLTILFLIKEEKRKIFIHLLKTFLFFSHKIVHFFLTISYIIIITKLYIFILLFYISQKMSENLI